MIEEGPLEHDPKVSTTFADRAGTLSFRLLVALFCRAEARAML
jgi:hypothetical protein